MQLLTSYNEDLQRYLERQEAPMSRLSPKIEPVGYQRAFLMRLKLATDDDRWHLRRCMGESIALCLTVPDTERFIFNGRKYTFIRDGFHPWKCVRTGALDGILIYYAKWHSYRNIKRLLSEMKEAERIRKADEDRKNATLHSKS